MQQINDIHVYINSLSHSETLKNVSVTKVYFLYKGRNAWYSTWTKKYAGNFMFSSLDFAKDHAEKLRKQGNVFYIEELPMITLKGSDHFIGVIQINSEQPFSSYSRIALTETPPYGRKLIDGARNSYLDLGSPLFGTLLSFDIPSRFWRVQQKTEDSIAFFRLDDFDRLDDITNDLKYYQSESEGVQWRLYWWEKESLISPEYCQKLITPSILGKGQIY